jgi:hypothetical protein
MRLIPGFSEGWVTTPFYANEPVSQTVSAAAFVGLCGYVWWAATRKERV